MKTKVKIQNVSFPVEIIQSSTSNNSTRTCFMSSEMLPLSMMSERKLEASGIYRF